MADFEQLRLEQPVPEQGPVVRDLSLIPAQQDELRMLGVDVVTKILDQAEIIETAPTAEEQTEAPTARVLGQLSFISHVKGLEFTTYEDTARQAIAEQLERPDDVLEVVAAMEAVFGPDGIPEEKFDPTLEGDAIRDLLKELFDDKDFPPYLVVDDVAMVISETYIQQQQVARGGQYPYASYMRARACVLGAMRVAYTAQSQPIVEQVEQDHLFVEPQEATHG